MNKTKIHDQTEVPATAAKRTRLHALVFSRAAFGTALATPGGGMDPKIPPFVGE
jgi:hypothetical protein